MFTFELHIMKQQRVISSDGLRSSDGSRKRYPTLCDPIDGSPPGSSVPGTLQARTLERVAISFSNAWKWKVKVKLLSRVRLLVTSWTAAYQAPPSMGFSRQEYWSGVPWARRRLLGAGDLLLLDLVLVRWVIPCVKKSELWAQGKVCAPHSVCVIAQ